jgi:hypothetical protein
MDSISKIYTICGRSRTGIVDSSRARDKDVLPQYFYVRVFMGRVHLSPTMYLKEDGKAREEIFFMYL